MWLFHPLFFVFLDADILRIMSASNPNVSAQYPLAPKRSPQLGFSIETRTTNQLSATVRTVFLIAIRMMVSTRHYIAIGTAKPVRKMHSFGIIGYGPKDLSVRVFNGGVRLTSRDGCVRHFSMATATNSHYLPAASN
jgi:hypothetical protein